MAFLTHGNYLVYNAPAKIYTEDAALMRQSFKDALDKGEKNFIINFAGTDYIDSAGLGVVVGIHKKALERGGGVKLVGVKGNVKEIFHLTRLSKIFEIYNSTHDI